MGKYCANSKNLISLKKLYNKNKIFSDTLKTKVFNTILEIFHNAVGRSLPHCLSTKTKKKCKHHKVLLRKLLDSSLDLDKRKQLFRNSDKKFKNLVVKYIIPDFWKSCVEKCK